jgi:hypothetical protein
VAVDAHMAERDWMRQGGSRQALHDKELFASIFSQYTSTAVPPKEGWEYTDTTLLMISPPP